MLFSTFLVVFGLSVLVLLHVFLLYPLSLILLRQLVWKKPTADAAMLAQPSLSIVFCAHNESASIREKIANVLEIKHAYPEVEVLVYADGCTDGTLDVLMEHAGEIRVFSDDQRRGKSHGMNTLLRHAKADVIVSTDANVKIAPQGLSQLSRYFSDSEVGLVCGHLVYTNPEDSATAAAGSLYWRIEEAIKRLESDTGSTMGADGSLFAYRRELFREVPEDIIDDMFTSLSILCDGYEVKRAEEFIAYESGVTRSREEFARKVRIGCRAFNAHRFLWPRLVRLSPLNLYKYISHKLLRWFAFYFVAVAVLALVGMFVVQGYGMVAVMGLAGGIALVGVGHFSRVKLAAIPGEVLLALAATAWGVIESLRGKRYQTWRIASTSRGAT